VSDFGLHMTLRRVDSGTLGDVPEMVAAGCPSFKAYTTYEGFRLDEREMLAAMQAVAAAGGLMMVHCEDDSMIKSAQARLIADGQTGPSAHPASRPPDAEAAAIRQIIELATRVKCRLYIVHISTREGVQAVREAKRAGVPVTGETCPQYLLLSDARYALAGFEPAKFVCSPPLRAAGHSDALWQGLSDGSLDVVATDHCPFYFRGQKDLGAQNFLQIPNGLPGIELRLALMHTFGVRAGRFGLADWVRLCATAPALEFGLHPKKGSLAPGSDADVVIFDPEFRMVVDSDALHEQVDYTPYEGLELVGYPKTVLVAGNILIEDRQLHAGQATGSFLPGRLGDEYQGPVDKPARIS
jgi:dihydropyrimidinase